ncbi:MAG: serine hydrolase domain-containing protein, partial [Anaerolineales bacterium]
MKKQDLENIDAVLKEWDRTDTPGCALGIIQDGELVHARGCGQANLEHGIPIMAGTRFYIASVSKQFTAACILLLAQRGNLSLQDDIREYLPEIPAYPDPVRIEHLIYHTSGLREHGVLSRMAGLCMPAYRLSDAVALLARQRDVNYPAGAMYLYNNAGYVLQAEIVQRVSGQPFSQFIQENIFEPLHMDATFVLEDCSQVITGSADSYAPDPSGGYRRYHMTNNVPGSAGVMTTVCDLFQWDQNFYKSRIGGETFASLMEAKGRLKNGQEIPYGIGLMHGRIQGMSAIYHGGVEFGYRALVARFPEKRFSVICLSNLANFSPYRVVEEVVKIFFPGSTPPATHVSRSGKRLPGADLLEEGCLGLYCDTNSGAYVILSLQEGQISAEILSSRLPLEIDASERAGGVRRLSLSCRNTLFPMSVQIRLEKTQQHGWQMQAAVEGCPFPLLIQSRAEAYDESRLAEYSGVYYSPELQSAYELNLHAGRLCASHASGPKGNLEPGPRDFFTLHG